MDEVQEATTPPLIHEQLVAQAAHVIHTTEPLLEHPEAYLAAQTTLQEIQEALREQATLEALLLELTALEVQLQKAQATTQAEVVVLRLDLQLHLIVKPDQLQAEALEVAVDQAAVGVVADQVAVVAIDRQVAADLADNI